MPPFREQDLHRLFALLNTELAAAEVSAELYLVGGAVVCLVHRARPSTQDVDGFFQPVAPVRQAAARVARQSKVSPHWLNDAVKGFLSEHGDYAPFLDLSHLKILTAQPEYLLTMKCLAFRIGAEFHDEDDIRYLLRYLNIESYEQAVEIIGRYYPLHRFPQKTLYALAELLPGGLEPTPGER